MKVIVTGGAGFIGSALIRYLINETDHHIVNVDRLTYAGNVESLESVERSERYRLAKLDICDQAEMRALFEREQPDLIMHLAAESHVDRSIDGPAVFIQTNVIGTFSLITAANEWLSGAESAKRDAFRFHHISTDEVYGDLEPGRLFTETTPYQPSSPYSASKAASDHLVRAWARTFNLPTIVTNCSNNYGPNQFPEKLIPLMITNAKLGKTLPVYGDGKQIRDWLYVDDHVRALYKVATEGRLGETYNIGGFNEKANIDVVHTICDLMEELYPQKPQGISAYRDLITFVTDRPGHDVRYAIDASKINSELGWSPEETFETGLRKTVSWYLANEQWCQNVLDGTYRETNARASSTS